MSTSEMDTLEIPRFNLMDLSDCVLLELFNYLDAYDLFTLTRTCERLKYLLEKQYIWRNLDLQDNRICRKKFIYLRRFVNSRCTVFKVKGMTKYNILCKNDSFFKSNEVQNLTILSLEDQCINSGLFKATELPRTLQELSLRGTGLVGPRDFLLGIDMKLVNLHTLILDNCMWNTITNYKAIAKLPKLENLSITGCAPISFLQVLFYFELYTFSTLRRLDVRLSNVDHNIILRRLSLLPTLRELYIESVSEDSSMYRDHHLVPILPRRNFKPVDCVQVGSKCSLTACDIRLNTKQILHTYIPITNATLENSTVAAIRSGRVNFPVLAWTSTPTVLFPPRYNQCMGFENTQTSSSEESDDNSEDGLPQRYRMPKRKYRKLTRKRRSTSTRFSVSSQLLQWTADEERLWQELRDFQDQERYRATVYPPLEVLCLRGIENVSDEFLMAVDQCGFPLRVLDLTGATLSAEAIEQYKQTNPDIHLINEALCDCAPLLQ